MRKDLCRKLPYKGSTDFSHGDGLLHREDPLNHGERVRQTLRRHTHQGSGSLTGDGRMHCERLRVVAWTGMGRACSWRAGYLLSTYAIWTWKGFRLGEGGNLLSALTFVSAKLPASSGARTLHR